MAKLVVDFDPQKDRRNRQKHGMSLAEGAVFDMESALIDYDDREEYGEERWRGLGFVHDRLCFMAWTYRQSTYWIISLRKAEPHEREVYAEYHR